MRECRSVLDIAHAMVREEGDASNERRKEVS